MTRDLIDTVQRTADDARNFLELLQDYGLYPLPPNHNEWVDVVREQVRSADSMFGVLAELEHLALLGLVHDAREANSDDLSSSNISEFQETLWANAGRFVSGGGALSLSEHPGVNSDRFASSLRKRIRRVDDLMRRLPPVITITHMKEPEIRPTEGQAKEIDWPTVGLRLGQVDSEDQQVEVTATFATGASPEDLSRLLAMGRIAAARRGLEAAQIELNSAVDAARDSSVSWADIGRVVKITAASAMRRWNAEARQRHSDYRRKKP